MGKKPRLTRILAITGTVSLALPLLFMLVTSLIGSIRRGRFLMDYFIPAEMFPLVLVGAGLLIWAAVRARIYLKPIGWTTGVALAGLVFSQVIAVLTGLASGERKAEGFLFGSVIAIYAIYVVGIIVIFIFGMKLSGNLFRINGPKPENQ